MASLEEFVSAVQSSIDSLKQAQSSMDAPKQQAEELSSQFQGLGAESMATGSQGLKEGVEQTQGMVPPIITQLEQIISSAQGMKSGLRAAAPDVRPPPTPLDAAPASLREPVAKVGDPVTAPGSGPGPYRQELTGHDEDDQAKSKSRRIARGMARNIADLQDQAKATTKSSLSIGKGYNPPQGPTYETVGVPSQPPSAISPAHAPSSDDTVGSLVVLTVVAAEGLSRAIRSWRNKDGQLPALSGHRSRCRSGSDGQGRGTERTGAEY